MKKKEEEWRGRRRSDGSLLKLPENIFGAVTLSAIKLGLSPGYQI